MRKFIILILLLPIFLNSCDDATISKKDLLTKSWSLNETTLNGEFYDHEAIYLKNSNYTFMDDETVQIVIAQSSEILNGTWQFVNKDTELTIAFSGVIYVYTIVKLDNSNLCLSRIESGDVYLYNFSKNLIECFT
ncbi:MAG: hypothetical protein GQ564_19870 [Bacteroidales bacterium]|nr:hypothetical protein [Bacteroidales bacterium]